MKNLNSISLFGIISAIAENGKIGETKWR